MEYTQNIQKTPSFERRNSFLVPDTEHGQMRSELILQQRKCERLEQKEKRIQVFIKIDFLL